MLFNSSWRTNFPEGTFFHARIHKDHGVHTLDLVHVAVFNDFSVIAEELPIIEGIHHVEAGAHHYEARYLTAPILDCISNVRPYTL